METEAVKMKLNKCIQAIHITMIDTSSCTLTKFHVCAKKTKSAKRSSGQVGHSYTFDHK